LNKIIVSISGASGFSLGMKFFKLLPNHLEKHLILTSHSKVVAEHEENIYSESQIDAPISSGSFKADAMIIIPCSMNTLAKVAVGLADNLTSRTASVMIKERKLLVLAPRELPFSPIHLENMLKLSRIGVVIAPPVLGYYSEIKTLEDMENFLIGKWFDILGIENSLYKRWD
jgi:4-hydroxy-3-polyprenylbenzoate decarboxylase